jgi:peroxiredoxin
MHNFEWPHNARSPEDDGGCNHLPGLALPSLALRSTSGVNREVGALAGTCVLYLYPMTGAPGVALPQGWLDIPGAPGCTPQSCGFRDQFQELQRRRCSVFGISTQAADDQRECAARLHLPYELLSDERLELAHALGLPTFQVDGRTLIKRQTLIVEEGRIVKVFYPIFPPHANAAEVVAWLDGNRHRLGSERELHR